MYVVDDHDDDDNNDDNDVDSLTASTARGQQRARSRVVEGGSSRLCRLVLSFFLAEGWW